MQNCNPGGRPIVAGTEAQSDMHEKCLIFTCEWPRWATAFLKESFAKIPISKFFGAFKP